ncbi:unnamed protein product, partial [Prorocentrum cordatum]
TYNFMMIDWPDLAHRAGYTRCRRRQRASRTGSCFRPAPTTACRPPSRSWLAAATQPPLAGWRRAACCLTGWTSAGTWTAGGTPISPSMARGAWASRGEPGTTARTSWSPSARRSPTALWTPRCPRARATTAQRWGASKATTWGLGSACPRATSACRSDSGCTGGSLVKGRRRAGQSSTFPASTTSSGWTSSPPRCTELRSRCERPLRDALEARRLAGVLLMSPVAAGARPIRPIGLLGLVPRGLAAGAADPGGPGSGRKWEGEGAPPRLNDNVASFRCGWAGVFRFGWRA